ncbi:hypothetical protein [Leucobacter sp. M11]|uniref:hypothetical protein n=1 Tax=Leucobacter sp. M11 TaxID=2993565 RepID=UPI002D7F9B35|nr:hypothetical protein [Leucobacter sp. M11]MEB4615020.1 hypothetical protein [Leucobacter sp. M11]
MSERFSYRDLAFAYRKAKVDVYYSDAVDLEKVAIYEERLEDNLNDLRKKLNGAKSEALAYVVKESFVGTAKLIPKALELNRKSSVFGENPIFSSPQIEWDEFYAKTGGTATYRPVADSPMDFHVLSALWIATAGDKYDQTLSVGSVLGNRIRRLNDGTVSRDSLGSFQPYFKPYEMWRNSGVLAMKEAVQRDGKAIAITADIKSFYHALNGSFLLEKEFLKRHSIALSSRERFLTELLIAAFNAWSMQHVWGKSQKIGGLPVKVAASSVVANIAMKDFDDYVLQKVKPIHYGRYVDDIILVLPGSTEAPSALNVWEWLIARSVFAGSLVTLSFEKADEFGQPDDIGISLLFKEPISLRVQRQKTKVFFLDGGPGLSLIDSIERGILESSSEHRHLPEFPAAPHQVAADLVRAISEESIRADTLRGASKLTLQRAQFALTLRDFEAHSRHLSPGQWETYRAQFFTTVLEHVLVPQNFFHLAKYLSRVFKLATENGDFAFVERMLRATHEVITQIHRDCSVEISPNGTYNSDSVLNAYLQSLGRELLVSIISSLPRGIRAEDLEGVHRELGKSFKSKSKLKHWEKRQFELLTRDLAHTPFRWEFIQRKFSSHSVNQERPIRDHKTFEKAFLKRFFSGTKVQLGIPDLHNWVGANPGDSEVFAGFLFATRPFSVQELSLVGEDTYNESSSESFGKIIASTRGFQVQQVLPLISDRNCLEIDSEGFTGKVEIAVASWKADEMRVQSTLSRKPENSLDEYRRLFSLVNKFSPSPTEPTYLVFPELAMPKEWFLAIARRTHQMSTTVISGIDYLHVDNHAVSNEVWAALPYSGLEVPTKVIYRQNKTEPAPGERINLKRTAGLELYSPGKGPKLVLNHGGFRFGLLICSELTNIDNRARFRGEVDVLFAPEWNRDLSSFSSLIESAALDIHAFIAQVNVRQYGDTRIRAPFSTDWKRDVLRHRGGRHDQIVSEIIDLHALREFQSSEHTNNTPFKPTPEGYRIADGRRRVPKPQS